mgnify:FL=1
MAGAHAAAKRSVLACPPEDLDLLTISTTAGQKPRPHPCSPLARSTRCVRSSERERRRRRADATGTRPSQILIADSVIAQALCHILTESSLEFLKVRQDHGCAPRVLTLGGPTGRLQTQQGLQGVRSGVQGTISYSLRQQITRTSDPSPLHRSCSQAVSRRPILSHPSSPRSTQRMSKRKLRMTPRHPLLPPSSAGAARSRKRCATRRRRPRSRRSCPRSKAPPWRWKSPPLPPHLERVRGKVA